MDAGYVRVIGKGDRERVVPVGDIAVEWLGRYMAWPRGAWLASAGEGDGPGSPLFVDAAGQAAGAPAGVAGREGRRRGRGPGRASVTAHAAPLVRDPPAGGRGRPAGRPGAPRTCEYLHHAALHAPHGGTDPRGLRPGASAGIGERSRDRWRTTQTRCSPRASGSSAARTSTGSCSRTTRATRCSRCSARSCSPCSACGSTSRAPCGRSWASSRSSCSSFGVISFLWSILRFRNEEYLITNRRIIHVEGVINKKTTDSSLEKINDAILTESVFGRMFGFGDLDVLTASEQGIERLRMLRDAEGLQDRDDRGQARARDRPVRGRRCRRCAASRRPSLQPRHRRPLRSPSPAPAPAPAPAAGAEPEKDVSDRTDEVADALTRLGELREQGLIYARGVRRQEAGAARAPLGRRIGRAR